MSYSDNYKLQNFIIGFKEFLNETQTQRVQDTISKFEKIFPVLKENNKNEQIYRAAYMPHFNIFQVMRYGNKETRLHTPFLRYLLDPSEDHYHGDKFLRNWVNLSFPDLIEENITRISVQEEKQFYGMGQIDLLISFWYKNQKYFIAIENKLDAKDQKNQLTRYYKILLKLTNNEIERTRLIYLTKLGRIPSEDSIEKALRKRLENQKILLYASYQIDVANQVKTLIASHIKTNLFTSTLDQYLSTISNF